MTEIEKSPQEIAKKLWNEMRLVVYMIRKGISKSKLMLDFHMLLKQGKLAGKAMSNLMLHHHNNYYATLTCRSNDAHMSFISPREYEFSCSTTPLHSSYNSKRKSHHRRRGHHHHHHYHYQPQEFNAMQKMFDILNHYDTVEESPLPGFGHSPTVRQLRVTDSPFPIKDTEDQINHQVDKDAEEFIKKFYKDLKNQKRIAAAFESPSPYHHKWGRGKTTAAFESPSPYHTWGR